MASMTTFLRRMRSDSGAELIEMAMVTPILMLIVGGIVDFGFMFRAWENVTNAAREGARVGVLPAYGCEAGDPDVEARVDEYMAAAGIGGSYDVITSPATVDTGTLTFNACSVTVRLTQSLPSLSVFGAFFGGSFTTVPVASRAVMRSETQAAAPAP
jgi:hypothetical protein